MNGRLVLLVLVGGLLWGALGVSGEDITLSTYYPSPRGVYDELRVNRLILRDETSEQTFGLTVRDGKLLMTDVDRKKTFLILDLNQPKP